MEKKERGFIGKLLVFILTILAVIGLISMTLSVICPHVDPKHFWWIPFFGLGFWVILLYNFIVFLFLIIILDFYIYVVYNIIVNNLIGG